ncbi:MAG: ABC transporter substrate-binding protein [Alphaproteobacteria bacterium]
MKKVLLLLMMFCLISCEKKEVVSDKPVVKIGATLPLTGSVALFGETMKKGMQMAVDEQNANSSNVFKYELIAENDEMNAKLARSNAMKFIGIDDVNVIVTALPPAGKIVNSIAEANKVIAFHTTYSDVVIDGKYNFQNLISRDKVVEKFVEFINERGFENIAILSLQNDGVIEITDNIEAELQNKKIESYRVMPSERSYGLIVSKIIRQDPDVLLVLALPPVVEMFSREWMLQKHNATIVGLEFYNNDPDLEKMFDDYYSIGVTDGTDEYIKKYGGRTYRSQYGYDGINIIAQVYESLGLQNGEIPTSDMIVDELHKIKYFKGVVGDIELDDKGQFHSNPVLIQIKNGKYNFLD